MDYKVALVEDLSAKLAKRNEGKEPQPELLPLVLRLEDDTVRYVLWDAHYTSIFRTHLLYKQWVTQM